MEQIGTPEELYERPASLFAAGFLGSPPMTFFPVTLLPQALTPAQQDLPESAVVGVRPENLDLGADAPDRLSAQVVNSEFLGAETLVYLDCAGRSIVARAPGRVDFASQQAVGLGWRAEDMHLFDEATGQRLDTSGPRSEGSDNRQDKHKQAGRMASL
ncbi:TOBE domain-containing protein [Fodinicurvata halophila]|uniref:TOBE domain-containing protein n=1 Tax=Fodinicurvata halophila TaxID=1419723 RepID=UPI003631CF7B